MWECEYHFEIPISTLLGYIQKQSCQIRGQFCSQRFQKPLHQFASPSRTRGLQWLHSLANTVFRYFTNGRPSRCEVALIAVWVCISLVLGDVGHLLTCPLKASHFPTTKYITKPQSPKSTPRRTDRHVDPWGRIQSQKHAQTQSRGLHLGGRQEHTTGKSLQQTVLGKLETTVRRTKLQPYLTPPTKIHSTWTGNPKLRPETPTSRGEYRESTVTRTLAMTSRSVGRTPSTEAAGASCDPAMKPPSKAERHPAGQKERRTHRLSDERLISKINKEVPYLTQQHKANKSICKWAKDLTDTSPKQTQMATGCFS